VNNIGMLNADLITLGYLEPGGSVARALARFQRHAKQIYRKTAAGAPAEDVPGYTGPEDGVAHQGTLDEIARWLQKGFRVPLGYFKLAEVGSWGALREEAASAWVGLMTRLRELGGTIDGPYGDTKRPLMKTISTGASKTSFHICGRAVDLNQGQTRYYVAKEPRGGETWWRIYCKTSDQSGAQGQRFEGALVYSFVSKKESPLPAGFYLDLTAEIQREGLFERIHAQRGWEQHSRQSEWWHFQWVPGKQETFQDECELVGITEKQLRAAGYTDADLDRAPG